MFKKITKNVQIVVEPIYLEEQSNPAENHYVWSYRVAIENQGTDTIQLKSRYWRITNAFGMTQEVRGDGVVGEQPVLKPGESYEYVSGTPLSTPGGFMTGSYQMQGNEPDIFDVEIPVFSLDLPHQHSTLH